MSQPGEDCKHNCKKRDWGLDHTAPEPSTRQAGALRYAMNSHPPHQ